jgi:hypothetical protein
MHIRIDPARDLFKVKETLWLLKNLRSPAGFVGKEDCSLLSLEIFVVVQRGRGSK